MSIVKHLTYASIINGSLGLLIWLSYSWARMGFFWSSDTLAVWLIAILITAIFICFLCFPILKLLVKVKPQYLIIISFFLGLVYVPVFFTLFTNYPLTLGYQLNNAWLYYLIFGLIGIVYSSMFVQKMPNKSFKQDK
jgi:hypothetical protein